MCNQQAANIVNKNGSNHDNDEFWLPPGIEKERGKK